MSAPSQERLCEACAHLSEADPALAKAHSEIGPPNWRVVEPGYAGLARMIAFQQISTKAAAAIWGRVCDAVGEITPSAMLDASDETLRGCGLSRPKISHLRAIAEANTCGDLPLETLGNHDIDDARARLVAVKGIGPWTADVFLMTATGALDAFPAGDVGLMESYRLLSGDQEKLKPKDFSARAEGWRPFRGVAAHLLWDWINAQRDRDIAPVSTG
ncbi:MAG: DNA-3-methyladenine glycosylase 2 family protein [Pseudomonadota bacterium]